MKLEIEMKLGPQSSDLNFIKEKAPNVTLKYLMGWVLLRMVFAKGKQRDFINNVCEELGISARKLCLLYKDRLGVSYSVMKRYRREEYLLPLHLVEELCQIADLPLESLEIQGLMPDNWGAIKGGRKGIRTLSAKYEQQLKGWRTKGGTTARKRQPSISLKKVILPTLNDRLSEFIGIHLGDGTLTKYFLKITQDPRYDLPYVSYIEALTKDLFGISPAIRKEKNGSLIYIQLFSRTACEYLHNKWNVPYGDKIKGKATIPHEIMENKELVISCLRGLMDTDGSVSKDGNNISIRFYSHNKVLVDQVEDIGRSLEIFTFRNPLETGTKSWNNVIEYFHIVGSSNLRHIVRFHQKFAENKMLRKEDVVRYYERYKGIKLPFKLDGPVV